MTIADKIIAIREDVANRSYDEIEIAASELLAGLSLAETRRVYSAVGLSSKKTSKESYARAIVQWCTNARYTFERTQF
ncbi:MAG: hypothetical protein EB060_10575 [Proteobacteria bacterium]|nr:hypothetical protein [Pseudomonadota bacterium]